LTQVPPLVARPDGVRGAATAQVRCDPRRPQAVRRHPGDERDSPARLEGSAPHRRTILDLIEMDNSSPRLQFCLAAAMRQRGGPADHAVVPVHATAIGWAWVDLEF
jgi:hypothetical protein